MGFHFHARRSRFLVLLGFIAVLAATLAAYLMRKQQASVEGRPLPASIAADIDQQTQAFSLSKTLEDHTVYTIRAQQVTNFKDTGKAVLRGVSILIYGKDGSRRDRISSAQCEYDPLSSSVLIPGEVEMQFDVPLAQPGAASESSSAPISIVTTRLHFDQKTGVASTEETVRFRLEQGEGTSRGATYDPQEQLLTLQAQVDFVVATDGTRVRAGTLRFYRQEGRMLLEHSVEIAKGTRRILAERGEVTLDAAYRARQASLDGGVIATEQTPTHSAEIRAEHGLAQFTPGGRVQSLQLEQAVQWATRSFTSQQEREGQAQRVALSFGEAEGRLERVLAEENVRVLLRRAGGGVAAFGPRDRSGRIGSGPGTQILSAQQAEMDLAADGETLRQVRMRQSPRLELSPAGPWEDRRTVTGDAFDMDFNAQGEIAEFAAQDNARVVMEDTGQASRQRVTTSDSLRATFDPLTNALDRVRQWGRFRYQDPDRQARAEQADYSVREERITLEGQPMAWNSRGRITANGMTLETKSSALSAEGRVSSTYFPEPSSTSPSAVLAPEPIHVLANRVHYASAGERAQYEGQARLWQGTSFLLEAEQLELRQKEGELLARDRVYSVFRQAPEAGNSRRAGAAPSAPTPGLPPAKNQSAVATSSEAFVIRSDSLLYQQKQRRAHYRGKVQLQNAGGTVTAAELEIFFQPPDSGAPVTLAIGDDQIERAEARGNVEIIERGAQRERQGERRATGDRAEYIPARGEVRLYGRLAEVFDPQRGNTQGAQLTYHVGDDTIFVEGEPGLPTETRWNVPP